jgi:nicotinate-nucleotide pyrophosphorylase (carboxylating)
MDWKNTKLEALLEAALVEDQAMRDETTALTVDAELRATARILARQDMVVCGLGAVARFYEIFARLSVQPQARRAFEVVSHPEIFDGVRVHEGQVLAVVRHNARVLLSCERVILNLMQHLSGIATEARHYVDAIEGTGARLLDTRKTIPGLRVLEKYAVACGGGTNHRMDLASGILIKNNHIALGGGVKQALTNALAHRKPGQRIEVEVRTPVELEDALACGAEALLLDNMTPKQVGESVRRIRQFTGGVLRGDPRYITTEASGGIVLANIRAYAEAGVEFISVGALTHSARAADISMRIEAEL